MDSGNKFYNTYIDIAVATLQEQLVQGLQLKTQVKIVSDLLSDKDQFIDNLSKELEETKRLKEESDSSSSNARYWEDSYHALQNKLSHMDTLTKQMTDMKNEIINKNGIISSLEQQIDDLKKKNDETVSSYEQQISDLKKKQKAKELAKEAKEVAEAKVETAITKVDLNNKVNDGKNEKVIVGEEKKKLPTDDF